MTKAVILREKSNLYKYLVYNQEDCIIYCITETEKYFQTRNNDPEHLIIGVMKEGIIINKLRTVKNISNYTKKRLEQLDNQYKRFENPHIYKVGLGYGLKQMKNKLKEELWKH